MQLAITCKTRITGIPENSAVQSAARHLLRDIQAVCLPSLQAGGTIVLKNDSSQATEMFTLRADKNMLELRAGDAHGFVYGLYAISREILGVNDLWFWNDQAFCAAEAYPVADHFFYQSNPFAVRYRGWFINDEVLLRTWRPYGSQTLPWEMAFEALLRLGGNMVIPGTGQNADAYRRIACNMGLYITHHHAEPLGATMFAQQHPELTASYARHPKLFQILWQEGIDRQKEDTVIWTLGFRGQGDRPFWDDDPQYQTPQARGKLISTIIQTQYDMVQASCPGAACCTNLYGEILELYRQGYIQIPDGVIKIWADNGYGKMVSRRQGNHNPRLQSLPEADERSGNGLYYHVSFYDLQAANHITMLGIPPAFVQKELTKALERSANDYWLINCSNVKPHVYYLDMIAKLWKGGAVALQAQQAAYAKQYYGTETVAACFHSYFDHAVRYGPHEDDIAGDQYYNYAARILVSAYIRGDAAAQALRWVSDADTLKQQTEAVLGVCRHAAPGYAEHVSQCEQVKQSLHGTARKLMEESFIVQANILHGCSLGALYACQSLLAAINEGDKQAFYLAGKSRNAYRAAAAAMRSSEHGKWQGFYANDCLTDIDRSAWLMGSLMAYLRNRGDGPHFYGWQREFLYEPGDARVLLITNMKKTLDDDQLFVLMDQNERA